MKKRFYLVVFAGMFTSLVQTQVAAQERYGNTLNLGVGVGGYYGYYRYVGNSLPVLNINMSLTRDEILL